MNFCTNKIFKAHLSTVTNQYSFFAINESQSRATKILSLFVFFFIINYFTSYTHVVRNGLLIGS